MIHLRDDHLADAAASVSWDADRPTVANFLDQVSAAQFSSRSVGPGRGGLLVKRIFDLVVTLILLVPATLVGALIATAIKLTSPGPVLFRQTRVGFHGRRFQVLKFRTMDADADARKHEVIYLNQADGVFKVKFDPRITRVGRFLRPSYLDELPQLINVMRGDMSLVGPRPLIPEEDAGVTGSGRQRLRVPPGMTGEWQLLRGAGASMDQIIAMDYRYVAEWSLWRDMRCLMRTAAYIVGRKGW